MRRGDRSGFIAARVSAAILLASGVCLGIPGSEGDSGSSSSEVESPGRERFVYHVRIVRIAGRAASAGAGYRCSGPCGTPIILPSDEAWGSQGQLSALAALLRGERADAVTGFIIQPAADGASRFKGTIYPGETWALLRFEAMAPKGDGEAHDIRVEIEAASGDGGAQSPLAEAHLLVRTERTVAFASPSPIPGEWIVVAVTPLAPAAVLDRLNRAADAAAVTIDPETEGPERIRTVDPVYPPAARAEKRSGRIILQAVIDTEGVPRAVTVLRLTPGCEDLAAASVDAIEQWRYKPATLRGEPIMMYFTVQVDFSLE